ncbi:MAG: hypothetical protein H6723_04770 [Sandaracinus sp.]|nr:hypothetical protein [Sandaracinus sp.]
MKRDVGDKRRIGPGLATADCRRARARDPRFDAWLRHAANDPDAACSLVEAYVCLAPVERRAFRAALRNDALRNASHARTVALVGSLDADPTWEAWENEGRVTIVASGAGGLTLERGRIRWSRRSEPEGARIPVPDAVDRVTRALWAARRAGRRWPPALSAFADLFDVASSDAG